MLGHFTRGLSQIRCPFVNELKQNPHNSGNNEKPIRAVHD